MNKLRKQYTNVGHPLVVLRFEDGHEIHIPKGQGKSFDIYPGEMVRILVVWDRSAEERELLESRRAEQFPDATNGGGD